jgi:hypothetical protein
MIIFRCTPAHLSSWTPPRMTHACQGKVQHNVPIAPVPPVFGMDCRYVSQPPASIRSESRAS